MRGGQERDLFHDTATDRYFKITSAAYYRPEDNLGIFDAHDKNLVRAGDELIPFAVIPCHSAGGFLDLIAETLAAGHSLHAVRTVMTAKQTSR